MHIGKQVNYVNANGEIRPAIVVRIHDDTTLNLQVFTDGPDDNEENVVWKSSVKLSTEMKPDTWHWSGASSWPLF